MFPVPSRGSVTVEGLEGVYGWSVVNALGQEIARGTGHGTTRLPLEGLKAGRYVLTVEQEGQRIRKPILVD